MPSNQASRRKIERADARQAPLSNARGMVFASRASGGSACLPAPSFPSIEDAPMSSAEFSRRAFLQTAAVGAAGAGARASARPARLRRRSDGRHRLCRRARRFRLEPGACRRGRGAEESARRQGRRGRERARDRRLRQDDGIDDQPRRRRADPRDLVRLLHAVRRRHGQEISRGRVPPRGAAVEQGQGPEERRQLFRLSQPGPLRRRRRRGPLDQVEQDRLRRRQADRQRAEQHQLVHARRAQGQSRTRSCR